MKRIWLLLVSMSMLIPAFASASLTFNNAITDRVYDTTNTSTNLKNYTAFTVVAWVYPNLKTASGNRQIWSTANASTALHQWRINTIGNDRANMSWRIITTAGTGQYRTSNAPLYNNTWNFIACTWNNSLATNQAHCYSGNLTRLATEDTYAETTNAPGNAISEGNGNILWGNRMFLDTAWDGNIANAQYINGSLNLSQIQRLQFQYLPASTVGVYHQLGSNGTSSQTDLSGNRNTGVNVGGTQGPNPGIRMRGRP